MAFAAIFLQGTFRLFLQIRNVETNQCLDNMGRKENEKVGIFNCHGMGGNQVKSNKRVLYNNLFSGAWVLQLRCRRVVLL